MEFERNVGEKCSRCHDTGRIKAKDGSVQVCMDCLLAGRLDVHSEKLPEHRIKL